MRVSLNATIWQAREQDGRLSIRISESRKDRETGSWETQNQFWATVRGDDAVAAVRALESDIAAAANHTGRPPFMSLSGYESGRGLKREDGSYASGFITITEVKPYESRQNAAPAAASTPAPAPAPRNYAAPTPAPVPAPAASPDGFMSIPDDVDEELPFN